MRATSMATASFLTVSTPASWRLSVAVKMDIRSSTVPRTPRRRKSRSSAQLEQIPAARLMDSSAAVERSAVLKSRKSKMTPLSCPTTFRSLHLRITPSYHQRRPGRHLPVLRSSRHEIRVWQYFRALPCTTFVQNTSTSSPSSNLVYSISWYDYIVSRPLFLSLRCRVTTLDKLFTPMCLCHQAV